MFADTCHTASPQGRAGWMKAAVPTTGQSLCDFPTSHPRDAPEGTMVDDLWLYLTSKLVLEAALRIQQIHHLDAA